MRTFNNDENFFKQLFDKARA